MKVSAGRPNALKNSTWIGRQRMSQGARDRQPNVLYQILYLKDRYLKIFVFPSL